MLFTLLLIQKALMAFVFMHGVYVCTHTMLCLWRSEDNFRGRFSPATMQIPGIEAGFLSLAGSTFTEPPGWSSLYFMIN